MASVFISVINLVVNSITLIIVVYVIFSWFLPPYHQAREMLGALLEPFLKPIRGLLPATGGIDFSPMILLIAIQLLGNLLISIIAGL
jgi:YggT family protein